MVCEPSPFFLPNDKALPAARKAELDVDSGIGGAGISNRLSNRSVGNGKGFSSKGVSVEEGNVDVELKRADADE